MNKKDMLRAINLLPRYNDPRPKLKARFRAEWKPTGKLLVMNLPVLTRPAIREVEKIIGRLDAAIATGDWLSYVKQVDVSGDDVWVIHHTLTWKHLKWLCERGFAWQKWRYGRLPIYVRYRGKLIVWNGTHRLTLSRLAGKKVRAAYLQLDAFLKWEKAHARKAKNKRRRA